MCVVAIDRDSDACAQAQRTLATGDERVRIITGDISTPDGARMAIETSVDAYGRLDLLCNNAAVHPLELIEEHKFETWSETFRVNVDGTMLCSQLALPHMKRQRSGAIVNIGSISGLVPYARGGRLRGFKSCDHDVDQGLGSGGGALRRNGKLYLPRIHSYSGQPN